jgi:Asp-tRNA(Asn)/Glu-tRNA(Gln) amidotransferase A subunit family amidase
MNLKQSTLFETRIAIQNKKTSPTEVTQFFLNQIETLNPKLNAFIKIHPQALERAKSLESQMSRSEDYKKKKLFGIPIAVKDSLSLSGIEVLSLLKLLRLNPSCV